MMRRGVCLCAWMLLLGAPGCVDPYENMDPDRVCLDTAYAVSNRVYACSDGDSDQAKAAFDDFRSRTRCLVQDVDTEPIAAYYDCPSQVLNAECDAVNSIMATEDVAGYLSLSPKCPLILSVDGVQGGDNG